MASSIMANTTQDEEKNAIESKVASQDIYTSQQNGESSETQEMNHASQGENGVDVAITMNETSRISGTDDQIQTKAQEGSGVQEGGEIQTPPSEPQEETGIKSEPQVEAMVVKEGIENKETSQEEPQVLEKDLQQETSDIKEIVTESQGRSKVHSETQPDVQKDGEEDNVDDDDNKGGGSSGNVVNSGIVEGDCVVEENNMSKNADGEVDDESDQDVDGDIDEYEDAVDDEEEVENGREIEDEDLEGEEPVQDEKVEKQLDHDQDRRNPQYIPKGGAFYEHDNRTASEDVKGKDAQDVDKKKKVWKESKKSERWSHDCYNEYEQQPKTKAEIMETYGYDIRNEEAPPRARRRRKYGRGPDKYDRNWEDEQAYMAKPNLSARRGKKKSFGREEFPPLPNQKNVESNAEKSPPKSQGWKKEEEPTRRTTKGTNSHEKSNRSPQMNRREYSGNRGGSGGTGDGVQTVNSNKKIFPQSKKITSDIKPFRQYDKTKWKSNNVKRGKTEEIFKTSKSKPVGQGESQTPRTIESNKSYSGDSDVGHVTEGFSQMTFHNKHSNLRDNRQDSNEITEQEMDSPARLNPKRYSKNRKGFTGFFPPEEIAEIDPIEMKRLQQEQQQKNQQHVSLQQQAFDIQNVIRRYPGTYNGNPGFTTPRSIIPGIPQQGMSPQGLQQALSSQGIPQQALSPQVPGLQAIEIQQGPIPPQPNFVPPIYMDPHYGPSEMMGPYTGYAPYSANQPGEVYQQSGGITYYNTECQNSNQIRGPPVRRPKTAIPILPPPK